MRVLMNALNAGNRSGTGRYITELVKALLQTDSGHDFTFTWPHELSAPVSGVENRLLRKSAHPLFRLPFEYFGMRGAARRVKADLLHYPSGVGPRYARLPVVLTVHDLCFFHQPEWFPRSRALYYHNIMAAGIRRADHLIADSQFTANDLTRIMNIPKSRIDVVPLGVDVCFRPATVDAQNQVRETYGLPERFFLFVGTLEPRKNLARIAEAYADIRDKVPPLVIAGRRGWGGTATLTGEGIVRIGHVPQEHLPALYSAADAFVWPSLMEGFGLPPLEAMACGTPVLTSNTSSLPEVVGDAALLVDPLRADAIADAMVALAQDGTLREDLRYKGLERAACFTWQATAKKNIAVYEKVFPALRK